MLKFYTLYVEKGSKAGLNILFFYEHIHLKNLVSQRSFNFRR